MLITISSFIRTLISPTFRWRLLFAVLAGVTSWFVTQYAFNNAPLTTDENSYVFQSYCFRDGVISRPVPPMKTIFEHEMIIMDEKAGWLSRYSPGHPLWLMPGAFFDYPRMMIILAAALGIWILGAIGNHLKIPPLFTPFVLFFCPFYQLMYGTLLSHTSGFVASAFMLWAYISWRQKGHYIYPVLTGIAWGWLFLNRTYTALLIGLPFGIDAVITLACKRDKKTLIGTLLFAGSAAIFIPLYMLYNYLAIGEPCTPTYLYYEPSEGLGFGARRTISDTTTITHTFEKGWASMVGHISTLNTMLFGMRGSMIILIILTLIGWSMRWSPLLFVSTITVWLGYIYFWYPGIREINPLYYFETLPFIILTACLGLKRIWHGMNRIPKIRIFSFLILFVTYACFSMTYMKEQIVKMEEHTHYEGFVLNLIQQAPPQSLVIVENMPQPLMGESILNPRGLLSDPIVSRSIYNENRVIAGCFSNRTPYIVRKSRRPKLVPLEIPDTPLTITIPVYRTFLLTGENITLPTDKKRTRIARHSINETGYLSYATYRFIGPGHYSAQLTYSMTGVNKDKPLRFEIAGGMGAYVIKGIDMYEDGDNQTAQFEFSIDKIHQIEPRIYYNGSGDVMLFNIQINEL